MYRESSLRHLYVGSGCPLALHTRRVLPPSRTSVSRLVFASSILGGTAMSNLYVLKKSLKKVCPSSVSELVYILFP
ncbi:hypothetical protein E2C01_077939 [Portunus trituberculatus]|uniref:Uncharacterized protein n=1 Tax=Portunus trituberculatus TaxID=210409 RepID=A0A5B7ILJ8_PORTR|nr:hypothetical protein [Portunus trituberculatus]